MRIYYMLDIPFNALMLLALYDFFMGMKNEP